MKNWFFAVSLVFISSSAIAENWVNYFSVPKTANPFDQAVYFADIDSIRPMQYQDIKYFVVNTRRDIEARKKSIYEIDRITCNGNSISPALAIGKMKVTEIRVAPDNSFADSPITTLDEFIFRKENLERDESGPFSSIVNLVCESVKPE